MKRWPHCRASAAPYPSRYLSPCLGGLWLCLSFGVAAGNDSTVLQEFIFESAPFPACHASTIIETRDGLLAAWFGGTHERHSDVGIWIARKIGHDWTTPLEVATGIHDDLTRYPTWNPVLFQASDGPILLFYKVGPTPRDWWGMVMASSDEGHTWSRPRRLPDGYLGPIKCKPIELSSGTILLPSSTEHDGWCVHFEFTNADATQWTKTAPVNDGEEIRAIQPTVLDHGNGHLQALGRTRRSGIFDIWSTDNGANWGKMTAATLPNPSAGIDAVALADGRFLLVYNHSSEIRSPLNVAISDDGKAWSAIMELENDPTSEAGFSYPAVIQTSDGLVHITYTWQRTHIKHVVLDPKQLDVTPIVDGKWPDIPVGGH